MGIVEDACGKAGVGGASVMAAEKDGEPKVSWGIDDWTPLTLDTLDSDW